MLLCRQIRHLLPLFALLVLAPILVTVQGFAQKAAAKPAGFEPLERWRKAVLTGDPAALKAFYSTQPPVHIQGNKFEANGAEDELRFWQERKETGLSGLTLKDLDVQPGENQSEQVMFQAEIASADSAGKRNWYLRMGQVWQKQAGTWRIVQVMRDDLRRLPQPMHAHMSHNLYPEDTDANAELRQGLAEAAKSGKRVIVVFGANWCYDCHALDLAFHQPDFQPFLEKNFVVLHIDVGRYDKNLDLADRYQVPLKKGIPALAVLKSDGTLLYSQRNGEFESARSLAPEDLQAFLDKWKPGQN